MLLLIHPPLSSFFSFNQFRSRWLTLAVFLFQPQAPPIGNLPIPGVFNPNDPMTRNKTSRH